MVVFAREPVPGAVKSRLAETIGDEAAARVYAATLAHTIEQATMSGARVVLSLAEVPSGDWLRGLSVPIETQRGDNLGDRLYNAFERRFNEGETRVVVVGSDCPWFVASHVALAAAKLGGADAVLGPAGDGGYWLVAQRPPGLPLFARIPWSSPETLVRTRRRIAALGGTWLELEELVDIDTAADLDIVLEDPRTPEALRRCLRDVLEQ